MSLMRQLAGLLAAVVLLTVAGAVAVNLLSAHYLLETQLRAKNKDNARSLALALSQLHGDAGLMTPLLAAQFETGAYRRLRFVRSDATLAFERHSELGAAQAPAWFTDAWPIESAPGMAQVNDGLQILGQIEVSSQVSSAHDELWRGTVRAGLLLAAIGLLASFVAVAGVRRIRRQLDATVAQANALEAGRYVLLDEPHVPELQRLARAMNAMVQRVQALFAAQGAQVETLRREAYEDPLTGLPHRAHFMQRLGVMLHGEDGVASGALVLLRLGEMGELNRAFGREVTDRALQAIADVLRDWPVGAGLAGRLNGADFALALPTSVPAAATTRALGDRLKTALEPINDALVVHLGAIDWQCGVAASALLAQADLALARAESGLPFSAAIISNSGAGPLQAGEQSWHQQLRGAMAKQRTRLVSYPVLTRDGALWQLECPLRVQRVPSGEFETAAQWLPLAARTRLLPQLDLHAVRLALEAISVDGRPRGINVALASLTDGAFTAQLRRLLDTAPHACSQLSLEVPEAAAVANFALLRAFAALVRPLGVRFGLEHAGHQLQRIERVFELGLDFVKLDAALTRGVASDEAARRFIQGSVTLLHAMTVTVCAEGVEDAHDAQVLWDCGIDAITGPWASAQAGAV